MKVVLFCQSIVSCWNNGHVHFLRGVTRELLRRGVEVVVYEPKRRRDIAAAGRQRFLRSHTPQNRARQIEDYYMEAMVERRTTRRLEVVA
jgi:spore maturation protein CgeB